MHSILSVFCSTVLALAPASTTSESRSKWFSYGVIAVVMIVGAIVTMHINQRGYKKGKASLASIGGQPVGEVKWKASSFASMHWGKAELWTLPGGIAYSTLKSGIGKPIYGPFIAVVHPNVSLGLMPGIWQVGQLVSSQRTEEGAEVVFRGSGVRMTVKLSLDEGQAKKVLAALRAGSLDQKS